jgi:hypothetical protein
MDKQYFCCVSGEVLSIERVEALISLGTPENLWTSVKYSNVQRKKGIYVGNKYGEDGLEELGELKLVNKVYDDSVSSIFRAETQEADPDSTEEADSNKED